MAEIEKADDYGLRASDYALPKSDGFNASDDKAADWLADTEIKISFAVLDYANDARGGRIDPERLSPNLDPALALPNPSEVIEFDRHPFRPGAYLRSFQPDQPQFEVLRQKLIELRGGKVETAEPVVTIPDGPVLKLGIEHEQVALLRKRLDMPSENADGTPLDEMKFDETVLEAVRHFQLAHGAVPDGMVGAGTRRMLNQRQQPHEAGSPARIRAVLINMERWRWLPHDLGAFYVTVNIPEFMLRVVEDSKRALHHARGGGETRQADADLLQRDADSRVRPLLERADLDQGRGDQALSQGRGCLVLRRRGLEHLGLPAARPTRQIWRPGSRSGRGRLEPGRHPQYWSSISPPAPATCSAG